MYLFLCSIFYFLFFRWRFVCVSLYILLSLKKCLSDKVLKCKGKESQAETPQAAPDLLSVNQQKTIRTCLQFVISMGVLPSLLPGVGISLAARSTSAQKLKVEELVILEVSKRKIKAGSHLCSAMQRIVDVFYNVF